MRKFGWMFLASLAMAQAPEFQPVGTMSQLMVNIIYPSSDAIFYVDRNPPSTDADWNALANQSLMLAESGNLLLMPSRARDKGNWIKDSKMMIDAGAAAFKAAKAKDLEAVRAVNDALYASCVTCHAQYREGYLKPKR
jgi:cytochrome c553